MREMKLANDHENGVWFGVLVDDEERLAASAFSSSHRVVTSQLTGLARKMTGSKPEPADHPLAHEMVGLFNGRGLPRQVRFNSEDITAFRQTVYNVLKQIPRGRVSTYGAIAKALDSGPRAVGAAVGSNPWTLFVPCHRVVPFDLTVGNYSMNGRISHESCETKKELLQREGVTLREDRISPSALWIPTGA